MKRLLMGQLFLFAILNSIGFSLAFGASVETFELKQLANIADDISVARCDEVSSYWVGDKIYTDYSFAVSEKIKGASGDKLLITSLGGTAIHPLMNVPIKMEVQGGGSYSVGEEFVLFTKLSPKGHRQIIGLRQGAFGIDSDDKTGVKVIPVGKKYLTTSSGREEVDLLFSPFSGFESEEVTVAVRYMKLEEFIHSIKSVLK
ncbi:hypothetical protein [Marinagarivorans cellulosilyticus]|uniref:Uncharacterized protein n=1 Tax=Marinagarivorans cellulosilyticus TaxID=2721545 RepID=A0AAN1WKB1_9GAMM|nr:hypothetical protein [Marinagarivorans cellulosilyticus]BCD99216.1 hypothetical protein MARGE09_P3417 [Marinagarivorans cellulosilyticus]